MVKNNYVCGLEHFLEKTEEDRLDVEGIFTQMQTYAEDTLNKLKQTGKARILDVGAGNGRKAINLGEKLSALGIVCKIDSIEPRGEQISLLKNNHRKNNNFYLGEIFNQTLDDFIPANSYDLILVIHSTYEFPMEDDGTLTCLSNLPELMNPNGSAIIVTEDITSDFYRMKKELCPIFQRKPPVSAIEIERTLKKCGLTYQEGELIKIKFYIDTDDEEIGKKLEFLVSESPDSLELKQIEHTIIREWVKRNLRFDDERAYLWIPNKVYWINYKNWGLLK